MNTPHASSSGQLTVFFDGACPLCRREIGIYQGLKPLEPIVWQDVSSPDSSLPVNCSRPALLARFHVQTAQGEMLSGAQAFTALWLALPGWRWLGKMARLPGMARVMEWLYVGFLKVRPGMQKLASRLFDKAGNGS